jgi:SAM-dependent methyltransferase
VMKEARNYNAYLAGLVLRWAGSAREALDFGAGNGTMGSLIRDRGLNLVCVEPDQRLAGSLRAAGFEVQPDVESIAGESFDYIFSLNVLEHIPDDAVTIARLSALLRPGGRLLLYVPAFQLLFSSMDARVGHLRRYRRSALVEICEHHGLKIEQAVYVDSLGFIASLVFRALGHPSGAINPLALKFFDRIVFPISRVLDFACSRFFGKNLLVVASREGDLDQPEGHL